MKTILMISLAALFYTYAGYPLAVFLLSLAGKRGVVRKGAHLPSVSVLIAAHNEEEHIGRTIDNKLGQDYPARRLEVIVVSDGSTDGTDGIVGGYSGRGVSLIRQERAGKTAALNLAAERAGGEILVFSDANSLYDRDAVRRLAENFHDPAVGYVTGKMVYVDRTGGAVGEGCTSYMRYENLLRGLETRLGSVVGVNGGIDAMRRSLYRPMRADQLPDFVLPLKVVEQGYRVVYEPKALLREDTLDQAGDEYRMRVRVSLRALWAIKDMAHLLNPLRRPTFSFELFSHKVLRYMAFLFLALAFVSNAALAGAGGFYAWLFAAQLLCYGAALLSAAGGVFGRRFGPLYLPYYFGLINLAAGHAFFKFLAGQRQVVWQPRKGA